MVKLKQPPETDSNWYDVAQYIAVVALIIVLGQLAITLYGE